MAWHAPYLELLDPYLIPVLAPIIIDYIPDLVTDKNGNVNGIKINGKEEGKWTYWHENGIDQRSITKGIVDTSMERSITKGKKSSEGEYRNGTKDGKWIEWYDGFSKSVSPPLFDGVKMR